MLINPVNSICRHKSYSSEVRVMIMLDGRNVTGIVAAKFDIDCSNIPKSSKL